jgi:TonB family protein
MLSRVVVFTFLLISAVCLSAQQTLQPSPEPTPSPSLVPATMAPERLLAFAIEHSGAGEVPGEGWHIKGTFDVLDGGASQYTTGSYEETWYAPRNYRRTYTYKGVTHTDIATPDGLFRSGDQSWPTLDEVLVRNLLVKPLPVEPFIASATLLVKDMNFSEVPLPCLFGVRKPPIRPNAKQEEALIDRSPRMCFDANAPVLRFTAGIGMPPYQLSFSKAVSLRGHLVAREISLGISSPPHMKVHVLEASVAPDPTGPMTPPADATKLSSPVTLPWEVISLNRLLTPEHLDYPNIAIKKKIQGNVHIAIVIGLDGTVTSAKVIDGSEVLRQAALDYVQTFKFSPLMLSGAPAEVHTVAEVPFGMVILTPKQEKEMGLPPVTAPPLPH